jgi:hypothetical protein
VLLLLLGIPCGQCDPVGRLPVEADLEGVLPGTGKGNIEHQDRPGFHIDHAGGRLAKLHRAFAAQELAAAVIDETDPDGMDTDLGAPAPDSKHQLSSGIHRGKVRQPHVLEHAQHAELALLIDQSVVGDDGEIEMQRLSDPDGGDHIVLLDLVDHVHSLGYLAEDCVDAIEVRLG